MKLTRQHFQLIAEVLAETTTMNGPDGQEWIDLAYLRNQFANRLAETNEQFDRQRFIDVATGVKTK